MPTELEYISQEIAKIRKEFQEFRVEIINVLVRIADALEGKRRY